MQPRQRIEECGLAGVWISDDRDAQRVPAQRPLVARRERSHGDSGGQGRAEGEPSSAHIQQHGVAGVNHTDVGPFTHAQCAQSARFVGRTFNVHNRRATSCSTRRQRTRARGARCGGMIDGGEVFSGHDVR